MPSHYSPDRGSFGSRRGGPHKRLRFEGEAITDYGFDLHRGAYGDLEALDRQLVGERAAGLPDYVRRAFEVGQGRLTDEATRSNRSFAAGLVQRARASGGRLDPNAALEYQLENERGVNEELFGARGALSAQEAGAQLEHTNRLLDSIMAIRDRKLGSAERTAALGIQTRLGALQGRKHQGQGTQAFMNLLSSIFQGTGGDIFKLFRGGGGGGGG